MKSSMKTSKMLSGFLLVGWGSVVGVVLAVGGSIFVSCSCGGRSPIGCLLSVCAISRAVSDAMQK